MIRNTLPKRGIPSNLDRGDTARAPSPTPSAGAQPPRAAGRQAASANAFITMPIQPRRPVLIVHLYKDRQRREDTEKSLVSSLSALAKAHSTRSHRTSTSSVSPPPPR